MTIIKTTTRPPTSRTLADIELIVCIKAPIFIRWENGKGDGELYMLTTDLNAVGITGELGGEFFNDLNELGEQAGEDLDLSEFIIIESVEILTSN